MDPKNIKDHKQIGQEQELFFTDDIAPGAPFWLPKGMIIFKELEKYIRELAEKAGYLETSTPIMVKTQIFVDSGHWDNFGEHAMYNLSLWEDNEIKELANILQGVKEEIKNEVTERSKSADKEPVYPFLKTINFKANSVDVQILNYDERLGAMFTPPVNYTLKPMNCPESTVLYKFRHRSYKELPLRFSEIGRLHRREQSGEVSGLLRVRQLTMDDAHIYATEEQIFDEVSSILDMMMDFYKKFGFEYEFRLATRPETRAGTDEGWDKAEKALADAIKKKKLKAGDKMGDGAFYGPKIDVHIKDSQERAWQLATVQLDFAQPEAFKLEYIDDKGERQRPVMIHRAILGSFERFIGILTEHLQGKFPLWLSPVQVVIVPIADRNVEYAQSVHDELITHHIRCELDDRSETMQAKIRDATLQKVPYQVIIGDREIKKNLISVRIRAGDDLGPMSITDFIKKLEKEIDQKV